MSYVLLNFICIYHFIQSTCPTGSVSVNIQKKMRSGRRQAHDGEFSLCRIKQIKSAFGSLLHIRSISRSE